MKTQSITTLILAVLVATAITLGTAAPAVAIEELTSTTTNTYSRSNDVCTQTSVTTYYFADGSVAYTDTTTMAVDIGYCYFGSVGFGNYFGVISPVTKIIPQFVDGGGWTTTLVLTNTTASLATAFLNFYQETPGGDGSTQPWRPTFVGESATLPNATPSFRLAGGATIFLQTPGTNPTRTQGWGQATVSDGVEISAIFGTAGGGQGTAPATIAGNHVLVPYNNTLGNVTSIAVANPANVPETVSVSFQSQSGAISRSSLIVPANGHKAFLLPMQFPGTAGRRGLAEFYAANGSVSLIGLQYNPANLFTTAQAYPLSRPSIIGAPDPILCLLDPSLPGCPQPAFWFTAFSATISSSPVFIVITPSTTNVGTYDASVNGTVGGATVKGSFVGGTSAGTDPITFTFTVVAPGSTFSSGALNFALGETAFDAARGESVGNVSGSITLNQQGVGSGTISGSYDQGIPLPPRLD